MDHIQFENKYEITKSLLKSWRKLSQKRSAKHRLWMALFVKLWSGVFAVLFLLIALFFNDPIAVSLFLIFGFSFIYFMVLPYIAFRRQFKRFSQVSGETTWIQTIRFGEDIEAQSSNSTTTFSYDKIRFIDSNEECFYLWVGENFMMVIYKNAFSVGNAGEFYSFIVEKCTKQAPLWTKRELNKRVLKKSLTRIITLIVMTIGLLLYIGSIALQLSIEL